MSDKDIRREIDANNQRARDDEDRDDGPIVETAEDIIDPLVRGIGTSEDADRDDIERRRAENDAEQQPE